MLLNTVVSSSQGATPPTVQHDSPAPVAEEYTIEVWCALTVENDLTQTL